MSGIPAAKPRSIEKSWLDRSLSLFADVRAGEGTTAVLMLANIFLLLICYSVIKTVREPLILLGGGAEVRSYAAAGQAILLMGFVPMYGWVASRVDRVKLLVGVTAFFIVCIELFASAVAAGVPYVGVAFFIWVGIFNISLVAQFWSFANDIYTKDAGDRLFPIIVMGMTAGAPLGSFIAARLFRLGLTPQLILQTSAALLTVSVLLYLWLNTRETRHTAPAEPLAGAGGFGLVLRSPYLRLIAVLIVLLNVVNTTGEYLIARLLSAHVNELALADPSFNKQAFIGGFSGDYQFWVNVTAFLLQAFVTARLVKYKGLRGVLLALPLIALGGYAIIAAGAGFAMVRWVKTAENATDYSIMNTARQLLWLPTSREEKYKAKQAIDTFFVRGGDVLSAGVVYMGTSVMHLGVSAFALGNVVLTILWIFVALRILAPVHAVPRLSPRRLATASAILIIVAGAAPARAQDTREDQLAAERAEKATNLHPYVPDKLESRLTRVQQVLLPQRPLYPFVGSVYEGGGFALGPGYRARFGDTGTFNAHGAWSVRSYKIVDAVLKSPDFANERVSVTAQGTWMDAPTVSFYGIGNDSLESNKGSFQYRTTNVGVTGRVQVAPQLSVGAGIDAFYVKTVDPIDPSYARSRLFAEYDTRRAKGYTRTGGFYRFDFTDYHQTNTGPLSFTRIDAQAQQYLPFLRENWVIVLRAETSAADSEAANGVPFYLMPHLGGSHKVRGYPSWRFRDRNSLLLTGEYRWTAGSFVDMELFMDAGKVAPRFSDLDLQDMKTSYGIGALFHTQLLTVMRVEFARTGEGYAAMVSFSPTF